MIYKIFIPKSVYIELKEVSEYYEIKQEGLGFAFIEKWEMAMEQVKLSPLLFQKKNKELRSIKLNKFPYLLIFEIVGNKIYMYRLSHAKRNPTKIYKK